MAEPTRLNLRGTRSSAGMVLDFDEGSFPVRTRLTIDEVEHALEIEQKMESNPLEAVRQARDLIVSLIRELTPDAVEPKLFIEDVGAILAALSGNVSVAQEVIDALRGLAGEDGAEGEGGKQGAAEGAEGAGAAPLASKKRSSKQSSRSGRSTTGRRAGGTRAPGKTSGSTSKKPAESTAA